MTLPGRYFFLMAWKANIIRHCDVHAWLHVLNIKLIWKGTQHANEGLNYSISNSPPPPRHSAELGWGKCPAHGLAKHRTFGEGLTPCPEEAVFSQSWKSVLQRQRDKNELCRTLQPRLLCLLSPRTRLSCTGTAPAPCKGFLCRME